MTAGRDHAYIVCTDWTIYSVDLATLDCSPTPFVAGQLGLDFDFGMEIDATSGAVLLTVDESLPSGPPYATLSYEGSVYLFGGNRVTRFEPPAPGSFSSRRVDAGAIGAGSYVLCP
jgi:hypothetical protein